MSQALLEVKNLKKYFPIRGGAFGGVTGQVKSVDDVSFTIHKGETLGLVGESGSGKTTTGQTILRMYEKTDGQVLFNGLDIFALSKKRLKSLRPRMQYIFQDPYSSLNPRLQIGDSIGEPLLEHGLATAHDVTEKVCDALVMCGMDPACVDRFPNEFSGGQRQRIVIARAMALRPEFVVADEPISALDVSIQAQIINLFSDLREKEGASFLFISHDLSVVEHLCERIAIMYLGILVETAPRDELFSHPVHPYTRALLSAIPVPDPTRKHNRIVLKGDVPSPTDPPSGCRFRTRCPYATEQCAQEVPSLREIGGGHRVACHLF